MSKRIDIIDPSRELGAPVGLIYSEILGWIDLGQALGRDIKKLLQQMAAGERGSQPYYEVFILSLCTSVNICWVRVFISSGW